MKNPNFYILLVCTTLSFQAASQTFSNIVLPAGSCVGYTSSASFVATGFPVETVFDVQISNAVGVYAPMPKVIGSGKTSPISIYFPAGISTGPGFRLRLASRTNPPVMSNSFIFNLSNCGNKVVTTNALAATDASKCMGTNLSIPFSTLNIPIADGSFAVEYKKQGAAVFTRIASTINQNRNQATIVFPLNFGTHSGISLRVIAVDNGGVTTATGSICPTPVNTTFCFTISDLNPSCKTTPGAMTVDSLLKGTRTGIPSTATLVAVLSSQVGVFPVIPILTFTGNSFPIPVQYPCTLPSGNGYMWRVTAIQNGVTLAEIYSKPFTVQNCPAVLSVETTTLLVKSRTLPPGSAFDNFDRVCLGDPETRIKLRAAGCFGANNRCTLLLRPADPTMPTVSVPITDMRQPISLRRSITPGYYSLELTSSQPMLRSVETDMVNFINCPKITLKSMCNTGNGTLLGAFSQEGNFSDGNQFRINSTPPILGVPASGTPGTSSPLSINTIPPAIAGGLAFTYSVGSSAPAVTSNALSYTLQNIPACPASAITLLQPASATICKYGMITASFTTTGLVDTLAKIQAILTSAEGTQFVMNPKFGKGSSPLTFDIPGIGNSQAYSLKLICANPNVTSNTISGFTLGNCASLAIGNFASGQTLCSGTQVSIPFTPSGAFNAGNSFRVELLDAAGGFGSPVTVGTGSASPIPATLPHYMAAGSSYKLRVVSTAPYVKTPAYTPAFAVVASPAIYNISLQANPILHQVVGKGFTNAMQLTYGNTPATYAFTSSVQFKANIPAGVLAGQMKVKAGGCFSNGMAYTLPPMARIAVEVEAEDQSEGAAQASVVFPNPCQAQATFSRSAASSPMSYRLISLMGREIQNGILEENQPRMVLDMSKEAKGMYFLICEENGIVKEYRIVKE